MFKSPKALWGNDWMGIDRIKGFGVRKVGVYVCLVIHTDTGAKGNPTLIK